MPLERCMELAPNMAPAGIVRVIVSCEIALCTPSDGAIRFDTVDAKGATAEYGNGVYGNAEQP